VVLLPVDNGLLVVRRGIEPKKGMLALPGGYINLGESWQEAAARELKEETGFEVDPSLIHHMATHSAPDGTLLVFGQAKPRAFTELPEFVPSDETSEIIILREPVPLAFSLHELVVAEYFSAGRKKHYF
jgi:8-oxo-dGTP pyrophosphatase MutT (NUDIX family)